MSAVTNALTPSLQFKLQVRAVPETLALQAVLLSAQVQVQCPQRSYSPAEKERLVELFGPPERWGETLRNRLWTHAQTTVGAFTGSTEVTLPVPCTFDLKVATAKYFHALEGGEVSLLFLFSGSVFYTTAEGRLQVERLSWNSECVYSVPVALWRETVEQLYPNSGWMVLEREVFDRLCTYKREQGFATWEQTMERLLPREVAIKVAAPQVTLGTAPAQAEVPA